MYYITIEKNSSLIYIDSRHTLKGAVAMMSIFGNKNTNSHGSGNINKNHIARKYARYDDSEQILNTEIDLFLSILIRQLQSKIEIVICYCIIYYLMFKIKTVAFME